MSTLSAAELRKYEWRIPTFLDRLATGTFITTSNTEVRLAYSGEGLEQKLRGDSSRAVGQLRFLDEHGNEYRLADLTKDAGFGGVGSRLKREGQALSLFRQKIEIEKHRNASDVVPVVIDGFCYYVSDVESTPGTPKSDFHFVDADGNEIVWISHKHGKSPRCFQQWAGCSARNEPNIHLHVETQRFAAVVRAAEIKPAVTVAAPVVDEHLQRLAVYGNDFGSDFGQNNVQLVIQGLPGISANTGNSHFDIVSTHVHTNGELLPENYAPTFMAMYRTDRNDFGIKNCRVGISPRKARLISDWIDHGTCEPHRAPRDAAADRESDHHPGSDELCGVRG